MDHVFPIGFSSQLAVYLVLLVSTLVVHLLLVQYVLAGSAVLIFTSTKKHTQHSNPSRSPVALVLRDWLPFAFGAAITAGVAPLLFVQVLYQHPFYTANLLLSLRWIVILPLLVLCFYMLYLLKSRAIGQWHTLARIFICICVFAGFALTAFTWSENHLLSLAGGAWTTHYVESRNFHWEPTLPWRFMITLFSAFPALATVVSWQLFRMGRPSHQSKLLPVLSITGLSGLVLSMIGLYAVADETTRQAITSPLSRFYLWSLGFGIVVQFVTWGSLQRTQRSSMVRGVLAGAGLVLTLISMVVLRESIRLHAVDFGALMQRSTRASETGGLYLFLLFLVVNAIIIGLVLRVVHRNFKGQDLRVAGPQ